MVFLLSASLAQRLTLFIGTTRTERRFSSIRKSGEKEIESKFGQVIRKAIKNGP
jgi:hypothetical protein